MKLSYQPFCEGISLDLFLDHPCSQRSKNVLGNENGVPRILLTWTTRGVSIRSPDFHGQAQ